MSLYVQSDTLSLAGVLESFQNKYREIYKLNPTHFFCTTRINLVRMLKKDRIRIEICN